VNGSARGDIPGTDIQDLDVGIEAGRKLVPIVGVHCDIHVRQFIFKVGQVRETVPREYYPEMVARRLRVRDSDIEASGEPPMKSDSQNCELPPRRWHSERSKSPRSFKSLANSHKISFMVPVSTHFANHRWQV
jgi:hypothetical protein